LLAVSPQRTSEQRDGLRYFAIQSADLQIGWICYLLSPGDGRKAASVCAPAVWGGCECVPRKFDQAGQQAGLIGEVGRTSRRRRTGRAAAGYLRPGAVKDREITTTAAANHQNAVENH
jgi:hypothetical protein